jgi:N-methylhydantoinase A
LRVADSVMARALRAISLERGIDARDASLMVFGGAGGLHGVSLARSMGITKVVVPPDAGVLSAQGLLWAAPARTRSLSVLLDQVPTAAERATLAAPLVADLRACFAADGTDAGKLKAIVSYDLRYRGQSFEIEQKECGTRQVRAFHEAHEARFGFCFGDEPVELVTVRVRIEGRAKLGRLRTLPAKGRRRLSKSEHRGFVGGAKLAGIDRAHLSAGMRIEGPAVIADPTATVLLDEKSRATVHPSGCLIIEVMP